MGILSIKRVSVYISGYSSCHGLHIKSDGISCIKMEKVEFYCLCYFKLINIDGLFNAVLFDVRDIDAFNINIISCHADLNDAKISLIDISPNELHIETFVVLRFYCVGSILKMKFYDIKKLYLDGDFTNSDLEICGVEYVNTLKTQPKNYLWIYCQLSVNDDYLYRLLSRELKITKRIFCVFIEWFKSQEFTNVYELFDIIVGYFNKEYKGLSKSVTFKNSIISHLIINESFSNKSVKKLCLEYESSVGLLKMLFDVNLFKNLVSLNISLGFYGDDFYINSSALNDIFSYSLESCEISYLSNIQELKCSFPELSLKIYTHNESFDFTCISRHLLCSLVIYGPDFVNILNCIKVSMNSMERYFDLYDLVDSFLYKKFHKIFSDSKYTQERKKLKISNL